MSRYAIETPNENLEITVGFEEGTRTFFLTIADTRVCTGESGTYIFHNYDHHPGMLMSLEEVVTTLKNFRIEMPPEVLEALNRDWNALPPPSEERSPLGNPD